MGDSGGRQVSDTPSVIVEASVFRDAGFSTAAKRQSSGALKNGRIAELSKEGD